MREKLSKHLIFCMVLAMVGTIILVLVIQTIAVNGSMNTDAREKLELVKQKLDSNQADIERLTGNVGENNLAKTRAFAEILSLNPALASSQEELEKLCKELMVRELHVIDENGFIVQSTVPEYIGFDMASGEQSAAFLPILKDEGLEIVQEPQENAAEGIVVQYIGVARKDAKGFVQVGIQPAILEETLAGTAVDVVLSEFEFGTDGCIFAVNPKEDAILAIDDKNLVGKSASEEGFPQNMKAGKGRLKINGRSYYYVAEEYDDMLIGTLLPATEHYKEILQTAFGIILCLLAVNVVLMVMVNRYVSQRIVKGITNIVDSLKKIQSGDYSVVIEEKENPEYEMLSSSINSMVASIRENFENNHRLFQEVKGVCGRLEDVSKDMLDSSSAINQGNIEQQDTIQELKNTMENLSGNLRAGAEKVGVISRSTTDSVVELEKMKESINQLSDSMEGIICASEEIGKIISQINAIAVQTNLLSLNASIESARAGELGLGFKVVATEVGALAMRSAQAADESTKLIENSMAAVEHGKRITENAIREFANIVRMIEKSGADVEQISTIMESYLKLIEETEMDMNRISMVVDRNAGIAMRSEETARSMAGTASELFDIVRR